jgi:hypothetical protein
MAVAVAAEMVAVVDTGGWQQHAAMRHKNQLEDERGTARGGGMTKAVA